MRQWADRPPSVAYAGTVEARGSVGPESSRTAGLSRSGRRAAIVLLVAIVAAALASPLTSLSRTVATGSPSASSAVARARPAPPLDTGMSASRPELVVVQQTLHRHGAALLSRDKAGYLADVAPAFQASQGVQFDNFAGVPLAAFDYVLDVALPTTDGRFAAAYAGAVLGARVNLQYRITGVDLLPDSRVQSLTFVAGPDGSWLLASDSDYDTLGAPSWRGLWDFGPVVALTTPHGVLLAHPDREESLPGLAQAVESAVAAVAAAWGPTTPTQVLVLLPDSTAELQAVGTVMISLDRLAAVAVAGSVDYAAGTATGQRVLLNPDSLVQMGARATLALLTHEITHIAARTATRPSTPMWLVEGFADVVGFDAVGAGPADGAVSLQAQIRAGDVPADLPTDAAFLAGGPGLGGVYAQAWLACRLLSTQLGLPNLVAVYRAVAGSDAPMTVLRDQLSERLGLTYEQFVAAWQASLSAELG